MANLGFIGLGVMGSRFVRRMLDGGHTVTGYNRTRSKAEDLISAGMQWAATPRTVAEASDITFIMVSDTAALREVMDGPDGALAGLAAGKVVVDMSTVSPAGSRALAEEVAQRGARLLDAPVSGGPSMVEQGTASIIIAGEEAAFRQVEPVLQEMVAKVSYVGPNGMALVLKLAGNISLAVQMLVFSEGVLLAEKNGIPRTTAVKVLLESALASPMLKYRGQFVLDLPDPAWFSLKMMQKDVLLALEAGRSAGVPMPASALTNEFLTAGRAMGLGEEDFAALFEVLTRLANG